MNKKSSNIFGVITFCANLAQVPLQDERTIKQDFDQLKNLNYELSISFRIRADYIQFIGKDIVLYSNLQRILALLMRPKDIYTQ